jgi:hypothetical protein
VAEIPKATNGLNVLTSVCAVLWLGSYVIVPSETFKVRKYCDDIHDSKSFRRKKLALASVGNYGTRNIL